MPDDTFRILGEMDFEKMDLPPILYKYCDWNNPHYKRILTHKELYLTPPSEFEDEFDCKVPIRYDLLTDDDIYQKYLKSSIKDDPNFTEQQHHEFALEWQNKGLLRDQERLKELEKVFFQEFNNLFGILCLTANCRNVQMWDKYAIGHSGFCVGFNTISLCKLTEYFGSGGVVNYSNELPIIKETDELEKKHFLQIHSKLKKWEFEEEYRLTKFNVKNRVAEIPADIFAEIRLGMKISKDQEKEIIEIGKKNFPNAKIYKAKPRN